MAYDPTNPMSREAQAHFASATPGIIDTPDGIAFVQLIARKGALKLELRGLRRRGRSAYSICKSEYGLRGSRESVLAQMQAKVDKVLSDRAHRAADDAQSALESARGIEQ